MFGRGCTRHSQRAGQTPDGGVLSLTKDRYRGLCDNTKGWFPELRKSWASKKKKKSIGWTFLFLWLKIHIIARRHWYVIFHNICLLHLAECSTIHTFNDTTGRHYQSIYVAEWEQGYELQTNQSQSEVFSEGTPESHLECVVFPAAHVLSFIHKGESTWKKQGGGGQPRGHLD